MRRVTRSLLLAMPIVVLAACGGGDDDSDAGPDLGGTAATDAGDGGGASDGDGDGDGATFGQVLEGTIEVAGAVDATYAPGATTQLVAAGGCQGPQFGVQLQVNDTSIPQTIVNAGASVDADLSGGATGTFDVEDLQVDVFEPGDLSQPLRFRGPATVEVSDHEAPADLDGRRMMLSITADALAASGEAPLDFRADIVWVMGCP